MRAGCSSGAARLRTRLQSGERGGRAIVSRLSAESTPAGLLFAALARARVAARQPALCPGLVCWSRSVLRARPFVQARGDRVRACLVQGGAELLDVRPLPAQVPGVDRGARFA